MNLAVLGSAASWYLEDLRRAARPRDTIVSLGFCQLGSSVGPGGLRVASGCDDLRTCDAVLVRSMPPGSLEQIVFRMVVLGRLEQAGTTVMNPPRAIEAAVDKYLATAKLQRAGLPVPRTYVCQTVDAALQAFQALGGDVVVKPLFGAEGRGITRIADDALMLRAAKMLSELGAVVYLQEFVDHEGHDLRLLVLGDRVLGIRRHNPCDWRTNVSRGASTAPAEVSGALADLARRAAAAIGAPLAGVDLLPGKDGMLYVIEVNAVPGWRALARTLDVDVAGLILETVDAAVSANRGGGRP